MVQVASSKGSNKNIFSKNCVCFGLSCGNLKKTVKGLAFVSSHSEHSQNWGTFPSSICSKHLKGKPLAMQTETRANSQKKQWNYEGSRREEVWKGHIWWNKGFEKLLCYTEESWSHAHDQGWMHVQKRPEKSPFFTSGKPSSSRHAGSEAGGRIVNRQGKCLRSISKTNIQSTKTERVFPPFSLSFSFSCFDSRYLRKFCQNTNWQLRQWNTDFSDHIWLRI